MSDETAQRVKPQIPAGLLELLPREQRSWNKMVEMIVRSYELFGYTPLATNGLEFMEVLTAKGDSEMRIFQMADDPNLALRFDLTVPLARYVAQHDRDIQFPFRRWQIGPVYRGETQQVGRGRFREFYQADVDVVGTNSLYYDAEVIQVMYRTLSALNIGPFTFRVNNRMLLNGILEYLNCLDRATDVLKVVDKLENGDRAVLIGALEELGLTTQQIDTLLEFTTLHGSVAEMEQRLLTLPVISAQYKQGVNDLLTVVRSTLAGGVPEGELVIDLSIARGLDYYTRTVMETLLNEHPEIGSICSGGRFDNLAQSYTARELPGVGMSIGLSRLFWQLNRLNLTPAASATPSQVMVALIGDQVPWAQTVANAFREANIPTEVYLDPTVKLGKQMAYANAQRIPWVAVVGEQEVQTQTISLKDMGSQEQQACSIAEAIELICLGG